MIWLLDSSNWKTGPVAVWRRRSRSRYLAEARGTPGGRGGTLRCRRLLTSANFTTKTCSTEAADDRLRRAIEIALTVTPARRA